MPLVLAAAAFIASGRLGAAPPVSIEGQSAPPPKVQPEFLPGKPWLDLGGNPINAHGGGVLFFGGTYYWYGEHKLQGKAEKDGADGGVHCYASTNLCDWRDAGVVLSVLDSGSPEDLAYGCILERPKVVFVQKTGNFVLFFKYYPRGTGYATGYVGVAAAKLPVGPFRYQHKFLGDDSPKGSGDFAIFQDADGAVYHLAVRKPDRALCIGKLREDCLFPAGKYEQIRGVAPETEAPALIRRGEKYFLFGSGSTGFEPNTMRVLVADALAGPYQRLANPCSGFNPHTRLGSDKTFGGQVSFLLRIEGQGDSFLAMLDVWKPERASDGLYIWLPVKWNGSTPNIEWRDRWDLSCFFDETQQNHRQ